jgi:hypothetical protein
MQSLAGIRHASESLGFRRTVARLEGSFLKSGQTVVESFIDESVAMLVGAASVGPSPSEAASIGSRHGLQRSPF